MPCIISRNELALSAFTLVSASNIASCVSGLHHVMSKFSDEEKENFLALVEWLPVTSRSHTHTHTHKCKISIMIVRPSPVRRYYITYNPCAIYTESTHEQQGRMREVNAMPCV